MSSLTSAYQAQRLQFLEAFIQERIHVQPNLTHRAFAQLPFGSLSIADRDHICPDVWNETDQLAKWPPETKALFLVGVQKGGTTFAFSVLKRHPGLVLPRYTPMSDGGSARSAGGPTATEPLFVKELHLFDGWPLPTRTNESFEAYFPSPSEVIEQGGTLIDSTPNYFYTAMAPARIKHILPQAKFVLLLRDPVMREYSHYQMRLRKAAAECAVRQLPAAPCKHEPFWEYVAENLEYQTARRCLFDEPGSNSTWGSCFRCSFTLKRDGACDAPPGGAAVATSEVCKASRYCTILFGNYAAQLAWWFAFFPPDRFLVLRSSDLHHPDDQVRVGIFNRIKRFAGISGPDFNASALARAVKHEGKYRVEHLPVNDMKALLALRLAYRQPLADLEALLRGDGVHGDFERLDEEISEAALQAEIANVEALQEA